MDNVFDKDLVVTNKKKFFYDFIRNLHINYSVNDWDDLMNVVDPDYLIISYVFSHKEVKEYLTEEIKANFNEIIFEIEETETKT